MADFHISAERRIPGLFFQVPPRCTKCHKMPVKYQCAKLAYCCWSALRAVHTGDKVDCCRIRQQSPVSTIWSTLLPVLATNRQQLEFDSLMRSTLLPIRSILSPLCTTGPKQHESRLSTKSTVLNSTLLPVCTGLNTSPLSDRSFC